MSTKKKKHRVPDSITRSLVYIPMPDSFYDSVDEEFAVQRKDGRLEALPDFWGILLWTLRRLPGRNSEDGDRALDIMQLIKDQKREGSDELVLSRSDYDWLVSRLKEGCHLVWNPPDAAVVRRYVTSAAVFGESETSQNGSGEAAEAVEAR